MNTNSINVLDFETSTLELVDEETKRSRSVGTRENVLVHEQTPDQILVLPALAQTSDLEKEDTVVVQHVVHLLEESTKVANTDVLGHLQARDLLETLGRDLNVAIIVAEDPALGLGNTALAETIVAPRSLVSTEGDTGDGRAVVDTGELGKSAPTAADIEHSLAGLEADLFTNNGELVVLQLLQRLFLIDIGDDTGGVNHPWTEKPAVKIVTTVVVVSNLLLVLASSVHDDFWHHSREEEPEQAHGEAEVGPVVSVLHDLKSVTLEVDKTVKVHLVEGLHWDLVLAAVLLSVGLAVEVEVVFDRETGVASLFVLARRHGRGNSPESH